MPQLFYLMRMGLHQVVDSTGEQTELAREEEDGEHDPVCRQHVVVLGLGKHPHVDVCDRPYQYRADQVGVYVAGLVVEVGQAEEDGLVFGLFWSIAGMDELVVSRPVLYLVIGEELWRSREMDSLLLRGAHFGGLRRRFLVRTYVGCLFCVLGSAVVRGRVVRSVVK